MPRLLLNITTAPPHPRTLTIHPTWSPELPPVLQPVVSPPLHSPAFQPLDAPQHALVHRDQAPPCTAIVETHNPSHAELTFPAVALSGGLEVSSPPLAPQHSLQCED